MLKKTIYSRVLCAFLLLLVTAGGVKALPDDHGTQSGTGFFVSNSGYIITNEHVVKGCDTVLLRGTLKPTAAKVIATDEDHDLALLKATRQAPRVATLRQTEQDIRLQDTVMVIGYPLDRGVSGMYKVAMSEIIGLEGPQEEPQWIQFADSTLQGNSGGPLLDSSGNVLGVIVGKATLQFTNQATQKIESEQKSDLAISLSVLKRFLHDNGVYFRSGASRGYYSIDRVENQAKRYVMNIHCTPSI